MSKMNKSEKNYIGRCVSRGGMFTLLISPAVYAEHNGGSDTGDSPLVNAGCNASFKSCSYAAPWPKVGSDPLEIGLLAVALCVLFFGKRLRKKVRAI